MKVSFRGWIVITIVLLLSMVIFFSREVYEEKPTENIFAKKDVYERSNQIVKDNEDKTIAMGREFATSKNHLRMRFNLSEDMKRTFIKQQYVISSSNKDKIFSLTGVTEKIPGTQQLESYLVKHHHRINEEVMKCIKNGKKGYPMAEIDQVQGGLTKGKHNWKCMWVKGYSNTQEEGKGFYYDELPTLAKIVDRIPEIKLLHVSIMSPGTFLPFHRGISSDVLRFHYPLKIPDGDCGGLIGNPRNGYSDDMKDYTYYPVRWASRKAIIFDDVTAHSFWNMTHKPRMIIFADFERPGADYSQSIKDLDLSDYQFKIKLPGV
jgi:hypothetical protein